MRDYYGTNNQRYIQHFGTKGMKWGYYDGSRNGKRTARKDEYELQETRYALQAGNADVNRDLGEKNKNYEQYYKSDKDYDKYLSKAKTAEKNAKTASGAGYMLGYTVGKMKNTCGKQINKAKKWLSKKFSNL